MTNLNLLGALFSFLRVLAVAEASAYLALTQASDEPVTWKACGLAAASALALSVINFFRPGESRFGPEPKVDPEAGYTTARVPWLVIGMALGGLLALTVFAA